MKRNLAVLGLLIVLSMSRPVFAGDDLVVVESTDPALTVGSVLSSDSLTVALGKRVVLIDQGGAMHRISGPHSGTLQTEPAAGGKRGVVNLLAGLVSDNKVETSTLGAVREVAGLEELHVETGLESLYADVEGDQCLNPGVLPDLRRGDVVEAETARISLVGGGSAEVTWERGDSKTVWPESVALGDGSTYLIRRVGASIPGKIILHLVPTTLEEPMDRVLWLTEHGCRSQARAMLDEILR